MDLQGIHRSVIFGFPWKNPDLVQKHNDYILDAVQKYPDRLIGFCCVDPLSKDAVWEVERCLKAGLKGIGELAIYHMGFTPEVILVLTDIMALSREYHAPILIHTNEPVGHQYPGKQPMSLGQLYELIKTYPSNRIVLAHWGGGLFFYTLMKREVKAALKNVWFDTAASPYLYIPEIYRMAGEIMGFEKILFGSDYPLLRPDRYITEMSPLGISAQAMSSIMGENARYLLELS
jgi:predicted TIM-barrel fold metal-dependent hydrolase